MYNRIIEKKKLKLLIVVLVFYQLLYLVYLLTKNKTKYKYCVNDKIKKGSNDILFIFIQSSE